MCTLKKKEEDLSSYFFVILVCSLFIVKMLAVYNL